VVNPTSITEPILLTTRVLDLMQQVLDQGVGVPNLMDMAKIILKLAEQ
jgi:hypothetical protein